MKKLVLTLIILIFTVLMTAGCTAKQTTEPTAVVFVVGMHENFPYQSTLASLRSEIYEACYSYGEVTFIVVDGSSYIGADYNISQPDVRIDNTKRRQLANKNTDQIMQQISTLKAVTPEVDTLSAMILAGDKLQASDCTTKKVILIDNACSTAGILNFAASQLIEDSPENIVNALRELRALPNLENVSVEVIGMGQTSGSQAQFTPIMKSKLICIWSEILEASGAAEVNIDSTPLAVTDSADDDLPPVTPITVITDTLTYTASLPAAEAPVTAEPAAPLLPEVVRFDETAIQFKGNLAEFTDKSQAMAALKPIAEILRAHPEKTVYLAGMTASAGGDGNALSLERAEAVKYLLTSMGCADGQIISVGLGRSPNHLRAADLDANGNLIDTMAKLNRAVFLFEQGSDTAVRLGLE